jgi:hypothetical protein
MRDFEFGTATTDAPPRSRARPQPAPWLKLWLTIFTSSLCSLLLAGLLLGLGVRWYIHSSIAEVVQKMNQKTASQQQQQTKP